VLNRAAPIISKLLTAFRSLLLHEQVSIILGEIIEEADCNVNGDSRDGEKENKRDDPFHFQTAH
jgi:hypothetical protein